MHAGLLSSSLSIVLSACCYGAHPDAAPPPSARMEQIALEMQRELPDVQRRFAGMSYDESFADGGDLAQRGMPRLPDAELVAFARLRTRLLGSSDSACAALVGGGDASAATAAFDALSDDEARSFMRITVHAQSLELAGGPRPMTPEAARTGAAEALAAIRQSLTADEQARWDRALASADPADACFVERALVREVARRSDGASLLRPLLEANQPP